MINAEHMWDYHDKHPLFKKHHQFEEFMGTQSDAEVLLSFSICAITLQSKINVR